MTNPDQIQAINEFGFTVDSKCITVQFFMNVMINNSRKITAISYELIESMHRELCNKIIIKRATKENRISG